jgi:hypothetical protein
MNKIWAKICWLLTPEFDYLSDGLYATDYRNHNDRQKIADAYKQRWQEPFKNPQTHPWKYDPLNPPQGWEYDPYYEIWIKVK